MKRLVSSIALLWLCAASAQTRADVPPPDAEACAGKSGDTACQTEDGKAGHCGDGTCSRATRDGSVSYGCYRCVPGAPVTVAPVAPKKSNCASGDGSAGLALAGALVVLGRRVFSRKPLRGLRES